MSQSHSYTEFHPRWHRTRLSTYWWLSRGSYIAFITRELSSVFVAWSVVYLLLLIRAVGQGVPAYQDFLRWSSNPLVLVVNIVTLLLVSFHAVTWFSLAPQAMVVRVGRTRVPGRFVLLANYVAWIVASAAVAYLVLGA